MQRVIIINGVPKRFSRRIQITLIRFLDRARNRVKRVITLRTQNGRNSNVKPPEARKPTERISFMTRFTNNIARTLHNFKLSMVLTSRNHKNNNNNRSNRFTSVLWNRRHCRLHVSQALSVEVRDATRVSTRSRALNQNPTQQLRHHNRHNRRQHYGQGRIGPEGKRSKIVIFQRKCTTSANEHRMSVAPVPSCGYFQYRGTRDFQPRGSTATAPWRHCDSIYQHQRRPTTPVGYAPEVFDRLFTIHAVQFSSVHTTQVIRENVPS